MVNRIICSLLLLGSFTLAFAQPTQTNPEKFLSVSDIHFSPFSSCKVLNIKPCPLITALIKAPVEDWRKILEEDNQGLSHYGQETNYALLKSTITELAKIQQKEHPGFALILGDFLAHAYRQQYILFSHDRSREGYQRFVAKTLQFVTNEMRDGLPNIDIYPAVGNNDSYTGDYGVVPNGQFFKDMQVSWAKLILDNSNKNDFNATFSKAGYYAVTSDKNLKIVVLNSVLFSPTAHGANIKQAAGRQLQWLHEQLQESSNAKQHVIIALHIPVGVDVFRTLKNAFAGIKEFWLSDFTAKFKQELQKFPRTVVAILPGHIHMDGFQIVMLDQVEEIPVSYTPSISPIYGNNPGFKVFSFNRETAELKNYNTYFYRLNAPMEGWQEEYNFNRVYQGACTKCDVRTGIDGLKADNELVAFYKEYYAVSRNAQPITEGNNWVPYYWCGVRDGITREEYERCLHLGLGFRGV